jgi:hypothetical protein
MKGTSVVPFMPPVFTTGSLMHLGVGLNNTFGNPSLVVQLLGGFCRVLTELFWLDSGPGAEIGWSHEFRNLFVTIGQLRCFDKKKTPWSESASELYRPSDRL